MVASSFNSLFTLMLLLGFDKLTGCHDSKAAKTEFTALEIFDVMGDHHFSHSRDSQFKQVVVAFIREV